jgi:hypothetical protein
MLIGVGTIVGLVVIFLGVVIFIGRTGYNNEVAQHGEAGAMTRLLLRLSPDLEIESEDGADGSLIVRSKSTGKRQRVRADKQTKKLVVTEDLPSGTPSSGGNAAKDLPAWLPAYAGVAMQKTEDSSNANGSLKIFSFATKDSAQQVLGFYEHHLKDAGLKIADMKIQPTGAILVAQDADGSRDVELAMSRSGEVVIKVVTTTAAAEKDK